MQDPKDNTNIILGVVLMLVVLMLGTSQYFDERAAGNVAAQLRSLLPSNALVIRDGKEITLAAPDLVTGDVVHMTLGSRVPADIKVIQTKDLKLDFSSLTGESDPIPMSVTAADEKPHESRNIAFMSSQVRCKQWKIVLRICAFKMERHVCHREHVCKPALNVSAGALPNCGTAHAAKA